MYSAIEVIFVISLITVQGLKDLVWLPIEQYRKDGRIVRGFQRGAASFGTSTAMAALELTNRMVQTIQVCLAVSSTIDKGRLILSEAHSELENKDKK